MVRGFLTSLARPGKWRSVRRAVLLHLDCRHEAIALAVERPHEAWRPPPLPQRLAQCPDTGFQRGVPDKLVGPQVLEDLLLGDHAVAMRQKVGEYLKGFAPQRERLPSVMQL